MEQNVEFKILNAVMEVNQDQKTRLFPKMRNYFKGDLSNKHIAVWGLAFKPDTDDIREAPALYMIEALLNAGASISAFDPEAMANVKHLLGDRIQYASNEYSVLDHADALMICTEWGVFRNPDFQELKKRMKDCVIFDGRNLYDIEEMNEKGFFYSSIGRNLIDNNK
jgi:UDPglucose 6-dehydrogenase